MSEDKQEMAPLGDFEIHLGKTGADSWVAVNGERVRNVQSLTVSTSAKNKTFLTLTVIPDRVRVTGDAGLMTWETLDHALPSGKLNKVSDAQWRAPTADEIKSRFAPDSVLGVRVEEARQSLQDSCVFAVWEGVWWRMTFIPDEQSGEPGVLYDVAFWPALRAEAKAGAMSESHDSREYRPATKEEAKSLAARTDVIWFEAGSLGQSMLLFADVDGVRYARSVFYKTDQEVLEGGLAVLITPAPWREATPLEMRSLLMEGAPAFEDLGDDSEYLYIKWDGLEWRNSVFEEDGRRRMLTEVRPDTTPAPESDAP